MNENQRHNVLEPEHPDDMVLDADEGTCRVYLACKHWTFPISAASSTFDFPADPVHCLQCKDERQLHPTLQWALQQAKDDGAATWQDLA